MAARTVISVAPEPLEQPATAPEPEPEQAPEPCSATSEEPLWHAALPTFIVQLLAGAGETWAPIAASKSPEGSAVAWATPTAGLLLGAALHWLLVDRWGRRRTLLLIPIMCTANSVQSNVLVSGLLWGTCSGLGLTTSYVYLAEIAAAGLRGRLCSVALAFHGLGRLYVRGLGPWLSLSALDLLALPFALLSGLLVLHAPDTPYYHSAHARPAHMLLALAQLRGEDKLEPHVREEAIAIHGHVTAEVTVRRRGCAHAVVLVVLLVGTLPLSGVTLTNADPSLLWGGRSHAVAVLAVVAQLVAVLVSAALVDRAGRRPLLGAGSLLMAMVALSLVAHHGLQSSWAPAWVPMLLQVMHGAAFYLGPGTVAFAYLGELLPMHCLATAPAAAACLFAVLHATVAALAEVAPLWALCSLSALWSSTLLALTLGALPETCGLPLHCPRLTSWTPTSRDTTEHFNENTIVMTE